ncbi:serine threonine protein kinase CMGC group [Coemansia sp. RSA 485]|nr:serine threonine protein kinase CMGC group [Coemansia sp. RSA 485]
MSVLSFVTSLFRSRNNHRIDDPNQHVADTNGPTRFRSSPGSPTLKNQNSANNRYADTKHTLSKQNLKPVTKHPLTNNTATNHEQPNQLRRIFSSSKTYNNNNANRPVAIKQRHPINSSKNSSSSLWRLQQKAEPSCDDRDGHYIVVPGRDFTPRFKIRRLLGQGTFGKVMECEDAVSNRLVAIKVIRAVPKYRDAAKTEIRVLQTLQRNDSKNMYQCMHVNETFDHRNHVCMVFDLLGPSVFDFLKENEFRPFSLHHVQLFAEQLLRSVAFLHSLNLVHTDLKPENILLESGEYDLVPFGSNHNVKTRMLKSTKIRLIDFGSATFNNEYHSQVVSTRHYRAPEIILNLGWSFPCDMWSIGCIILELLTGEALFQTHDNNEHLAMMEIVVGKAPAHIVRAVSQDLRTKFFRSDLSARYPSPDQPRQSQKGLRAMRSLSQLVNPATNPIYANLHDLLFRLLQYDPWARITAKEACEHPFFRYRVGPDGRLINRPPPAVAHHSHHNISGNLMAPASDMAPSPISASATTATSSSLQHQNQNQNQNQHQHQHHYPQHRPALPNISSGGAMPQYPASVAVSSTTNAYVYGSNAAPVSSRAPLHMSDYSIAASSGGSSTYQQQQHHSHNQTAFAKIAGITSSQSVAQPQQQQHGYYYRNDHQLAAPVSSSSSSSVVGHHHSQYYPSAYSSQSTTMHHQPQQQPQYSRARADGYSWQQLPLGSRVASVHSPITSHSNAVPDNQYTAQVASAVSNSGYNYHQQQQQQVQAQPQAASGAATYSQSRTSSKRKAGGPIDSGYFPDMPPMSAGGDGFASGNVRSSPIVGNSSSNSSQQHLPRNYSSSSVFSAAQPGSGPIGMTGYSATHGSGKGCNLPSLAASTFQRSPAGLSMAPLMTPTSSSVSLPQQHPYHQQRHLLHMAAGPCAGNGSGLTRLPIDSNVTPRLTTATTATPTPGSTSAHMSGSHSLDNVNASGNVPSSATSTSASINVASLAGSHKLAGRSLPSLVLPGTANNSIPHVGAISSGLARTSLGEASLGGHHQQSSVAARSNYYHQLPSAQTLMQSPTQPQAPGSMSMDYAVSHYHHPHYAHRHQPPPSAANNPGY